VNNEVGSIWKEEVMANYLRIFLESQRKAMRNLEPEPAIPLGYTSMANDKLHIFCIILRNIWNALSTSLSGIKVSEVKSFKLKLEPPPSSINK
jgi:hypothetical protein